MFCRKCELVINVKVADGVHADAAFVEDVSQTHFTAHVAVVNKGRATAHVRASAVGMLC